MCFFLQDASKVPDWLKINKGAVPDLVCKDPKVSWQNINAHIYVRVATLPYRDLDLMLSIGADL